MKKKKIFKYILTDAYERYGFGENEKEEFLNIIKPIMQHREFKKRLDSRTFPHHDDVSLGEHLLNDAALTYKLSKKYTTNSRLAVLIALFHDLYELPWQSPRVLKNHFFNKHGFCHPVEAAINAYTWFPEYFKDEEENKIIIDGIIHHMWPFPVRALNGSELELNNQEKFDKLPDDVKKLIKESTLRKKLGKISFSRSLYLEGRILSKADKSVSFRRDLSIRGALSCIIGYKQK